ncbi:heterokaryon incompatibility protein-domain-containing protein [Cladorrhinum sp. PSN332]|nr:heterokaryon incompatibility protein-domain-containing protein [Cladorrhinum sp. PSN332]
MAESGRLCGVCSKVDFARYFSSVVNKNEGTSAPIAHPEAALRLGSLADIAERSSQCDFCYLVVEALTVRWSCSGTPSERRNAVAKAKDKAGEPAQCLLFSFVTGRSRSGDPDPWDPKHESYNIGLTTTRGDADRVIRPTPWSLEGSIALMYRDAEKIGREPLGNGRLVPPLLDCALIRGWLREYESEHVPASSSSPSLCNPEGTQDIEDLLVIDTRAMCVVEAPKPCRFVALSYCWGTAPVFRLVKSNREALAHVGSVNAVWDRLPTTVRDAITLCRDLGVQYLWVDSICIVQDDDAHRSAQIAQMNKIYQGSILTIVCTDGTHANAGLPGVGTPTLCLSRKPKDSRPHHGRAPVAFFICGEHIFCEDTVLEGSGPGWYHAIVHNRPARRPRGLYGLVLQVWSFPLSYEHHLRAYTRRKITYQSDIIDAFQGVMGAFPGQRFWQGLPEVYHDAALLWTTTGASPRREGFPSWSWSGWIGEADTPLGSDIGGFYTDFQSAVEWYLMNDDGDVIRLESQAVVPRLASHPHSGSAGVQPPEYFRRSIGVSRALPSTLLPRLLPNRDTAREAGLSWRNPRFLLGWMRVAVLGMRSEDPGIPARGSAILWPSKETTFCVLGRDQQPIGRVVLDGGPSRLGSLGLAAASETQRYAFALLSRTWRPARGLYTMADEPRELLERLTGHSGPWPLVNVLLITIGHDGVAERIGVGFVHEQEWEAAKPEDIFLTLK